MPGISSSGPRVDVIALVASVGGEPLGMLSTHFRDPHRPSEQELRRLDLYARQATDFIERQRIDAALRESKGIRRLALASGRMGV